MTRPTVARQLVKLISVRQATVSHQHDGKLCAP
jgi:hypothetical protein